MHGLVSGSLSNWREKQDRRHGVGYSGERDTGLGRGASTPKGK